MPLAFTFVFPVYLISHMFYYIYELYPTPHFVPEGIFLFHEIYYYPCFDFKVLMFSFLEKYSPLLLLLFSLLLSIIYVY